MRKDAVREIGDGATAGVKDVTGGARMSKKFEVRSIEERRSVGCWTWRNVLDDRREWILVCCGDNESSVRPGQLIRGELTPTPCGILTQQLIDYSLQLGVMDVN